MAAKSTWMCGRGLALGVTVCALVYMSIHASTAIVSVNDVGSILMMRNNINCFCQLIPSLNQLISVNHLLN